MSETDYELPEEHPFRRRTLDLVLPGARYFALPHPPTRPETIAAAMMAAAHTEAMKLGVELGEYLVDVLQLMEDPEREARLAHPENYHNDPKTAEITRAMLKGCEEALQANPEHMGHVAHTGDARTALMELKLAPCPCCGRAFGDGL
jgi:hypothetical protein